VAKKLYVGNLPFSATEEEINSVFSPYTPTSVAIVNDRETGRSRGFAFVEVEDADRAVQEINGSDMGGRKLVVNEARERAPRSGGYQGGGSSSGGYDRGGDRGGYSKNRW
jgi:cold-inducible RNA-binding protein